MAPASHDAIDRDAVESSLSLILPIFSVPNHFPTLERLVIRLDDSENHHRPARQAWMDELCQFALGRVAYDTVARVPFRGDGSRRRARRQEGQVVYEGATAAPPSPFYTMPFNS